MKKKQTIYHVTNATTGVKVLEAAYSPQEACQQAGWLIVDCYVVPAKPQRKPGHTTGPSVFIKLPCQVCPYQYGECVRTEEQTCPCQSETPELNEWFRQASLAHLCEFTGGHLTHKDYYLRQKWVTVEEALRILRPRSSSAA